MMQKIRLLTVFFMAFFGAVDGVKDQQEDSIKTEVNRTMNELRDQAVESNPDKPKVIAIQEAAIEQAKNNVMAQESIQDKKQTAAQTFLGFYMINSKTRPEYCQKLGIEIEQFVDLFKSSHAQEMATANQILKLTPDQQKQIYLLISDQLNQLIDDDMQFIAKEWQVDLSGACQMLNDQANLIVPDMHLSVMQPVLHQQLMSN